MSAAHLSPTARLLEAVSHRPAPLTAVERKAGTSFFADVLEQALAYQARVFASAETARAAAAGLEERFNSVDWVMSRSPTAEQCSNQSAAFATHLASYKRLRTEHKTYEFAIAKLTEVVGFLTRSNPTDIQLRRVECSGRSVEDEWTFASLLRQGKQLLDNGMPDLTARVAALGNLLDSRKTQINTAQLYIKRGIVGPSKTDLYQLTAPTILGGSNAWYNEAMVDYQEPTVEQLIEDCPENLRRLPWNEPLPPATDNTYTREQVLAGLRQYAHAAVLVPTPAASASGAAPTPAAASSVAAPPALQAAPRTPSPPPEESGEAASGASVAAAASSVAAPPAPLADEGGEAPSGASVAAAASATKSRRRKK